MENSALNTTATDILNFLVEHGQAPSHHTLVNELGQDMLLIDEALMLLDRRGFADFYVAMVGEYASIEATDAGRAVVAAGQKVS